MFEGLYQPVHLTVIAILGLLVITPFWRIFKRAGFTPWLSLLMLVPLANFFALYYLAFARWPEETK